ncbi:50S ribosomal protein L33 [Fructilactobacillus sanfranciscensis]|nr:50S ribosomal protein L33 [Fructilactobacillus sanfranciscensis]MCG7194272.1 50S ribosomal protein L33 [Fructilactobacillus sanfranciscensis]
MSQKKVALSCTICGSRNYTITAKPNRETRLELKKYCKHCGKNTIHRETH